MSASPPVSHTNDLLHVVRANLFSCSDQRLQKAWNTRRAAEEWQCEVVVAVWKDCLACIPRDSGGDCQCCCMPVIGISHEHYSSKHRDDLGRSHGLSHGAYGSPLAYLPYTLTAMRPTLRGTQFVPQGGQPPGVCTPAQSSRDF